MKKLLLSLTFLLGLFVFSASAQCGRIDGTIYATGGVPPGWSTTIVYYMDVEIWQLQSNGTWLQVNLTLTDTNGFYHFNIANCGVYKIVPKRFGTPYEGTFDRKPVILAMVGQDELATDFVYDFANY